jgi:protein required for attachment to host cells
MIIPANAHVALVDGEKFLLLRNSGTATEARLEVESTPTVARNNKSAGMRHQDALDTVDDGTSSAEPLDKFAHAAGVAEWLNKAILDKRIKQLVIAADQRTLGELRIHLDKQSQGAIIAEISKELAWMPPPEVLKVIEAA